MAAILDGGIDAQFLAADLVETKRLVGGIMCSGVALQNSSWHRIGSLCCV
jgi:hypothetical protein